jgi:hypothetical protein
MNTFAPPSLTTWSCGPACDLQLQRYPAAVERRRRLVWGVDPEARPVGHLRVRDDGLDSLACVLSDHEHEF